MATNEVYVTMRTFVVVLVTTIGSLTGTFGAIGGFIYKQHLEQPHPGAATSKDLDNILDHVKEIRTNQREIRTDLKELIKRQ